MKWATTVTCPPRGRVTTLPRALHPFLNNNNICLNNNRDATFREQPYQDTQHGFLPPGHVINYHAKFILRHLRPTPAVKIICSYFGGGVNVHNDTGQCPTWHSILHICMMHYQPSRHYHCIIISSILLMEYGINLRTAINFTLQA